MNKKVYPVVLTQTGDETILIEVPDMEILTQGKDFCDAIEMARDAIGIKGISMEDAGEEIPDPSDLSSVQLDKGTFVDEGKSIVTLIDVDFVAYRKNNCEEEKNLDMKAQLKKLQQPIKRSLAEIEKFDKQIREAVRKQNAVKPELCGNGYDSDGEIVIDTWICPRCHKSYEIEFDEYNYCPNCGQKIDRTEIEKIWG